MFMDRISSKKELRIIDCNNSVLYMFLGCKMEALDPNIPKQILLCTFKEKVIIIYATLITRFVFGK